MRGGTTGEGKAGGSKKLVSRAEGDVHSICLPCSMAMQRRQNAFPKA